MVGCHSLFSQKYWVFQIVIPIDFNSFIFFRGVFPQPPTSTSANVHGNFASIPLPPAMVGCHGGHFSATASGWGHHCHCPHLGRCCHPAPSDLDRDHPGTDRRTFCGEGRHWVSFNTEVAEAVPQELQQNSTSTKKTRHASGHQ